ncbi:hypothetical protein [Ilumatobacter sp.]|uniref:hypothetical protein n=1 Tax=Ilumatobacter sp. TaxID=1967498 RepID=UPI003B51F10E
MGPLVTASGRSRDLVSTPRLVGSGALVVVSVALGAAWPVALVIGAVAYAVSLLLPTRARSASAGGAMDPFTVGEPWRQLVQRAQRSARQLHDTVDATAEGPLRERLVGIAARLDSALDETWAIARRGDQIDSTIRGLDPTRLRADLEALEERRSRAPGDDLDAAVASLRGQIASTERLRAESERTADRLRLTQARLDELVSRAAEVGVGAGDGETYAHDVDDLVIELESLRLAVDEVNRP